MYPGEHSHTFNLISFLFTTPGGAMHSAVLPIGQLSRHFAFSQYKTFLSSILIK